MSANVQHWLCVDGLNGRRGSRGRMISCWRLGSHCPLQQHLVLTLRIATESSVASLNTSRPGVQLHMRCTHPGQHVACCCASQATAALRPMASVTSIDRLIMLVSFPSLRTACGAAARAIVHGNSTRACSAVQQAPSLLLTRKSEDSSVMYTCEGVLGKLCCSCCLFEKVPRFVHGP